MTFEQKLREIFWLQLIFESQIDIKFLEEFGISTMSTNNNSKDIMQAQLDVRSITCRTAKKDHICHFSGKAIEAGDSYWEITFTKADGGSHYTYRVSADEFEQFIKEKLFMVAGFDYEEMEADIGALGFTIDAMLEKYKDVPAFEARYLRAVSLGHRAK